jgi:hypothetical protein
VTVPNRAGLPPLDSAHDESLDIPGRASGDSAGGTFADPSAPRVSVSPGLIAAAIALCLYGGLALTVDFPRAAIGIQSDEATYYMMGHSLASDGDLTYRREDLIRVWREFSSGPSGVFLKRGRDVKGFVLSAKPPFFHILTDPDPDPNRWYYAKSFAYPLVAAPFVRILGTNGFLVLHALLLAADLFCAYLFLRARAPSPSSLLLAVGFVMVSVVPVYVVWITPELFNFSLGLLAYFCWLYKEVASPDRTPRGPRWLFCGRSDLIASALLGLGTFSKVSNALLFLPIVIWQVIGRRFRVAAASAGLFGIIAVGLFSGNVAITGEWNYQGGDRSTYVHEYPLQSVAPHANLGVAKSREEALTGIIFDRRVFWTNLAHNLGYFFVGRYAGVVAYFFPAAFAMAAFLSAARRRPVWQWLVLASGVAQILFFIIVTPYTWNGGGGSVGNRYFMGAYGVFLFLFPAMTRVSLAAIPWVIGSLFVSPLVLNPFVSSFYPGNAAKSGPLRLLPPELTLVYDWPINTDQGRVRQWFGDNPDQKDPGFQIYFFDDNAFGREDDKSFWVKGESRAEFLVKTDRPMRRLVMTLTAGPVPTDVTATVAGRTQRVALQPGRSQQVFFTLDRGFLYQGQWPVWTVSVSSSRGFVPSLVEESTDSRYLGVRVKPTLVE